MAENQLTTNRQYKDRLFHFLFREKQDLLSLYNAVNGSAYDNPDELEIHTLDDVIYLSMHNDVSFLIDNRINLYEEQSSWNPNMPLRGMLYLSRLYSGYIADKDLNIYTSTKLKLPFPQFVVFYIGQDRKFKRKKLRLSDSFPTIDGLTPCIECTADVINIRNGYNDELVNSCQKLSGYSFLVCTLQDYIRQGYSTKQAADLAIERCLQQDILTDFLKRYRAEVSDMLLTEYDEEWYKKAFRREGKEEGIAIGMEQMSLLQAKLLELNRIDDLKRSTTDSNFRKQLLEEFHIEQEIERKIEEKIQREFSDD